ncbi:MAG: hypothetical protein ACLP7Q_03820 [Isosphaeraceae bacterium]
MESTVWMRYAFVITCSFGVFCSLGSARARAQEVDAKARFLAEAPAAWKVLATIADHVEVHAIHVDAIVGIKGARPDFKRKFRFLSNGQFLRAEHLGMESTGSFAYVVNPRYGFCVGRTTDKDPFQIKDIRKPDDDGIRVEIENLALGWIRPAFGDWVNFQEMHAESKIVIKRVTASRVASEELVRVEFESNPQRIGKLPWRKGSVTLAPDQLWGFRQYDVSGVWGTEKGKFTGVVEYGQKIEGLPSLRRIHLSKFDESGKYPTNSSEEIETTFTKWVHRDAPEQEFTLTSFGLPEIADPPKGASSTHQSWWLILGALSLAATVTLHLTRRSRAI